MDSSEKFLSELHKTSEVVKQGGIILYPTDTVWGIGCDATDSEAVARIYRLKRRADSKSMLSLVASPDMLAEWVDNIPQEAFALIETTSNPLTVIYDHPKGVAENLLADDGSMGIRISNDDFCRALCLECGVPIVSTSANVSGQPAAGFFSEIDEIILRNVDYVVDLRRDDKNSCPPSSIVKIDSDGKIIRIR